MKPITKIGKYIFVAALTILSCMTAKAETVEINGIWYTLYRATDYSVAQASAVFRPDRQPYKLKDIVIPDEVTYDNEKYAVTQIGVSAFAGCEGLETVTLGNNVWEVGSYAFYNTTLQHIEFPEKEVYISISALCKCPNLETIVFNSKMTEIEADERNLLAKNIVFKGDSKLTPMPTGISANAPEIKKEPAGVEEPAGDMRIDWGEGRHDIFKCGMTWFTGDKLTLSGRTRIYCNIYGIGISQTTTLELEKKIERDNDMPQYITALAFEDADNLTTIICHDTDPWPIEDLKFLKEGQKEHITVCVPRASLDVYKAHPAWGKFRKFVAIEDGVEAIEADNEAAPVEYFNLQGQRVAEPASGSTVIRRQGTSVSKVLIP